MVHEQTEQTGGVSLKIPSDLISQISFFNLFSGTCDNNQANDCTSPSGQVESCKDTAPNWKDPSKPCIPPTTLPPVPETTIAPPTTPYPCNPVICELLKSR